MSLLRVCCPYSDNISQITLQFEKIGAFFKVRYLKNLIKYDNKNGG
jgi:hypothetical protein